MSSHARYLYLIITFYILPFQLFAKDIRGLEMVVFKLYVDNKAWGQVNILCDSTKYYVHLPELLSYLEYKYEVDPENKKFRGWLSEKDSIYYDINCDSMDAGWDDFNDLYVESSFIEKKYDFQAIFTFGSLALNIIPKTPVPAILRIIRQEKIVEMQKEKELRRLTNIDTLTPQRFKINSIGYSLNANISKESDLSYRGNLNGELFKGSYLVNYDLTTDNQWSKNVTVNWIKPFLDKKWLKTLRVYHDFNNMKISSDNYLTGVMISNEHPNNSSLTGHTFQGRTTPNTDVEIYNNNQLTQYLKSDSLGNYTVEVPSYEGENNIKAISYDSFGIPMINESLVYIPPGLQEKGKLLYIASAGFNDNGEFYINPRMEYGLLKKLSVGLSNETIFGYDRLKSIAILNFKFTPSRAIRLNLDYIPTVKWNTSIIASIKNILSANISYEKYNPAQTIIQKNITENFTANISGRIPIKKINGNYYINVQHYKMGATSYYTSQLSLNIWWRKFNTSLALNTISGELKFENPNLTLKGGYSVSNKWYNEMVVNYNKLSGYEIQPRTSYQFNNKLNFFAEMSYTFKHNSYNLSLGMSWQLPFMQLRSGFYNSKNFSSAYINTTGSGQINNRRTFTPSDRYVAEGSLLIIPYLDINGDMEHNVNEPIMPKTKVLIYTGADMKQTNSGVLFSNIAANVPFKIYIPNQAYEDISWQIKPQERCLILAPYQSRKLYLPVHILSELIGQVTINHGGQIAGVSNVPIIVKHHDSGKITRTKTDDWGYYSHMGVCGTYNIELDEDALKNMGLACTKPIQALLINPSTEGLQIDNLNFEVYKTE